MDDALNDTKEGTPGKKVYSKPELKQYGNVRELTKTGGLTTDDGKGNRRAGV